MEHSKKRSYDLSFPIRRRTPDHPVVCFFHYPASADGFDQRADERFPWQREDHLGGDYPLPAFPGISALFSDRKG